MSNDVRYRFCTFTGLLLLAVLPNCFESGRGGRKAKTGGFSTSVGRRTAQDANGAAKSENTSSGAESTTTGGSEVSGASTLKPLPSGPHRNVPRPSGTVRSPNLRILPWAGFAAAVSYTFDDTQPSQKEHWEALKATGIAMTFFANPSGNWQSDFDATWSAVAAAGSEIGNHTWSHCHATLTDCTPIGTAAEEIDEATEYIKSRFGVAEVPSFAAPFGDTGWNATATSRFLLGRGVARGSIPVTGISDWYNLPVFPADAGQTATQFNAAIDETQRQGRWTIFLFHSILPTSSNWYAGVQIEEILASITHVKSLKNVWVDTFGAIGAYLRAQQMFEALRPENDTWNWTLPDHFPKGRVLRVTVDGGTLSQNGRPLAWDPHGYYEIALDVRELSWLP